MYLGYFYKIPTKEEANFELQIRNQVNMDVIAIVEVCTPFPPEIDCDFTWQLQPCEHSAVVDLANLEKIAA
jgi:hypothetical protein